MSALYPQLLDPANFGPTAPQIDTPPTYTDIFNEYFADAVTPEAGIDDLIAAAIALDDAWEADLPNFAIDLASLVNDAGDPANPFDTSGGDAVAAAWPGVQADAVAVCQQFTAVLAFTGVPPTGQCDAAATTVTGTTGGGGGGTGSGQPSGPPYPTNPNPPSPGAPACADSIATTVLAPTIPDLVLGGAPYVLDISAPQIYAGVRSLYAHPGIVSGATDLVTVLPSHADPANVGFWTNCTVIIYPARSGSFNVGLEWGSSGNDPNAAGICLSFNVVAGSSAAPIPPATPMTPDQVLATVAGKNVGVATVDLGTFKLGANPIASYAGNDQWGYSTSGVYTWGMVVQGPADMLVPWGETDDPVSPGAFTILGFAVLPIRVGTWAWLVQFYEDAAHTIPVYLCFTATVTAS